MIHAPTIWKQTAKKHIGGEPKQVSGSQVKLLWETSVLRQAIHFNIYLVWREKV